MVCLRAFGFSLGQWTNQICRGTWTSLLMGVNSCLGGIEKRKPGMAPYYNSAVIIQL